MPEADVVIGVRVSDAGSASNSDHVTRNETQCAPTPPAGSPRIGRRAGDLLPARFHAHAWVESRRGDESSPLRREDVLGAEIVRLKAKTKR
jgi:hypothetical protein